MVPLALAALALVGVARAGSIHVDQASIFLHRGYFSDAVAEVDAGLADPSSGDAFALYSIGVDAAWELGDIDHVLVWSAQAADLALDADAHDAWQARHDTVAATWGWVVVAGPVARAALDLAPETPVVDPEQKRIAAAVAQRLQAPQALPTRVALPAGAWRVNGATVTVIAGQTAKVTLAGDAAGLGGLGALRALRIQGEIGVEFVASPSAAGRGGTFAVTLDGPLAASAGALRLAGSLRWAPVAYVTDEGRAVVSPWAGAGGIALALERPLASGLAVRAQFGGDVTLIEGVPRMCPTTACGGAARLYLPAWGVGPAGEVAITSRHDARSIGVSLGGALGLGRTVTSGVASVAGALVPWALPPSPIALGAMRISLSVGL